MGRSFLDVPKSRPGEFPQPNKIASPSFTRAKQNTR